MTASETVSTLVPTQASGRAFIQRAIAGEVVMLKLLRVCAEVDYSASPELAFTRRRATMG